MEVHHHTHQEHTERKKWKNYFWEFLMLFLAVFAGFLAENQREHIVEHKRAKVYAANLYKELQKDTTAIGNLMRWTDTLVHKFDSLCEIASIQPAVPNGKLYFYAAYTGWIRYFSSESSTMDQLKNSGNLRIMPTEIALKISEYERRLKSLENDYSLFRIEYENMLGLRLKIFDGVTSVNLFARYRNAGVRDSIFALEPALVNNDPRLMKEFLGWVKSEADFWETNIRDHLAPLNKTAGKIIELLKKEYHLK
jgi:hypothetical protein